MLSTNELTHDLSVLKTPHTHTHINNIKSWIFKTQSWYYVFCEWRLLLADTHTHTHSAQNEYQLLLIKKLKMTNASQ